MRRITLIRDAAGERCYAPWAYPLSLGGTGSDIPLSGGGKVLAYIASESGHPFVQPADGQSLVWHNHQRLNGSAWLKSGDQLQIDQHQLLWQVQGEQISVSISETDVPPDLSPPLPPDKDAAGMLLEPLPQKRGGRGFRWFLLALFLLLLGFAAFVMLATPVNLEIDPEPDSLALRGFPPALLVGDAFLALPGRYHLVASRAGYRDLKEPLQVESGKPLLVRQSLRKQPGLVSVETSPQGALLLVDGEPAGRTPLLDLEIEAGRHQLRLEVSRHRPRELELDVLGMQRRQQVKLILQPDWARVSLRSDPPGADISGNGQPLGRTPADLELQEGEHQLTLSMAGFKQRQLTLQVQAGEPRDLPLVTLEPADGVLDLRSVPAGGSVSVDGQFRGRTPIQLSLSSGHRHQVRLTLAGYQAASFDIELAAEEAREREVQLQPGYGVVFFSSQPADAQLLVDGKPAGLATTRLRLSTRPHDIEVRKPGYKSFRTSLLPSSDSSRNLEVVLQPLGAGRADAPAKTGDEGLAYIKPGAPFTLGASRREAGRRANENLRQVVLSRPYYIGLREVSNGEFRRFRSGHKSGSVGGVSLDGDDRPVVNVSWEDAARYLNWLSEQQGLPTAYLEENGKMRLKRPLTTGYRLPSEAEWAYAARFAGRPQAARFPWPGDTFPPADVQGNFGDVSARGVLPLVLEGYRDGYSATAPVGSFSANAAGLYDVGGNVAEWVHDYYAVYPAVVGKTARDPMGPDQGRHHVVRGSSWRDAGISELRLSYRDYSERPRDDLGFRVARFAR